GVVAVVTLSAAASVYAVVHSLRQAGRSADDISRLFDDTVDDRDELVVAFSDPTPPTPAQAREFGDAIRSAVRLMPASPAGAAETVFDPDRLVTALERQGIKNRARGSSHARDVTTTRAVLAVKATGLQQEWNWDSTTVLRVRVSDDGDEAIVIAAHTYKT